MSGIVCEGGVTAVPGPGHTAGPVVEVTTSKLKVGGAAVVLTASCPFATTSTPPVAVPVDWKQTSGKLVVAGQHPLSEASLTHESGNVLNGVPNPKLMVG